MVLVPGKNWHQTRIVRNDYICSGCHSYRSNPYRLGGLTWAEWKRNNGLYVTPTTHRTTPWKPGEISHPELTRIRAEHIRRYALADKVEAAARDGFVYVMSHTIYSPGVVKIGHSRDPYKRAAQANTNSAEGKHIIKYIRFFKDRALAESLVHSDLWHQRTQGEHFRVSVGEAIGVIANMDE